MRIEDCKIGMEIISKGYTGGIHERNYPEKGTKGIIKRIDPRDDITGLKVYVLWEKAIECGIKTSWVSENSLEERKEEKTMTITEARIIAQRALSDKNIRVEFDGYKTTATNISTGKTGVAYCLREDRDKYDVAIGVAIAYNKVTAVELPKLYTATVYGLEEKDKEQLIKGCKKLGLTISVEEE